MSEIASGSANTTSGITQNMTGNMQGVGGMVGGIYAGNKSASALRHAAGAANDRLGAAQREALAQLAPYSQYGQQALSPLSALIYGKSYNPDTGEFADISQEERMKSFQQSPGYQYQLDEGLKAIQRQNAATGTLLGGNTLKELQGYGSNLANQDYYNYINTLFSQAGIGSNAATNSANIISNMGSQMAGYSYAGGMGNAQKYANLSNLMFGLSGQGFQNANAGIQQAGQGWGGSGGSSSGMGGMGGMAGLSSMFGGGASSGAGAAAAASDKRLKENITKVGEEKGFNIYEFNYRDQPNKRFRGVIAQEVQDIMPEAIIKLDKGYLGVDYSKIGIDFREVE